MNAVKQRTVIPFLQEEIDRLFKLVSWERGILYMKLPIKTGLDANAPELVGIVKDTTINNQLVPYGFLAMNVSGKIRTAQYSSELFESMMGISSLYLKDVSTSPKRSVTVDYNHILKIS